MGDLQISTSGSRSKSTKLDDNVLTGPDDRSAPHPEVVYDTASSSQELFAARDIGNGLANYQLWSLIGWRDVKQRYRRSTLGPFWVTLSMALMVVGLGLVYSMLFRMDLRTYLPFVGLGLIIWEFISKSILEGSSTFLLLEGLIKQIRLPLTTHVVVAIWRNLIILGHNLLIYLVLLAIFAINPGWSALWAVPGLVLVILNLIWVALLLALVCTRFRDVPLIVQSAVQMIFFVTPVFWSPELMPHRTILVHGNPFFHMIALVREPLLGHAPTLDSWIFLLITLVLGWVGTFIIFTKFRRRVAYWL